MSLLTLPSDGPLVFSTEICDYNITVSSTNNTCNSLATAYNIESSSIWKLNPVGCNLIPSGTYCTSQPCQIATIPTQMGATMFLQSSPGYSNITITQFISWNPFSNTDNFIKGDVVCIGYVITIPHFPAKHDGFLCC